MPQPASPSTALADELAHIRRLRFASLAEGSTLLILLLVAAPLKHGLGYAPATRSMGPVHGAAFVAYAWCLVAAVSGGGWSRGEIARLALAAFIPFGAFLNAGLLRRRQASIAAGATERR